MFKRIISYLSIVLLTACVGMEKTAQPFGILQIDQHDQDIIDGELTAWYRIHFTRNVEAYTTIYYQQVDGTYVDTGVSNYNKIKKSVRKQAHHSVGVLEVLTLNRPAHLKVIIRAERGTLFKDTISKEHYLIIK